MLDPVPMVKLRVVALERDEEQLLHTLGRLGLLQLTQPMPEPETSAWLPRDLASARQRNTSQRARLEHLAAQVGIPVPEESAHPLEEPSFDLEAVLLRLEEQLRTLKAETEGKASHLHDLGGPAQWLSRYGDTGLGNPRPESSFLWVQTGVLPASNLAALEKATATSATLLALTPPDPAGPLPIILFATPSRRPQLEPMLREAGFEFVSPPTERERQELEAGTPELLARELRQLESKFQEVRGSAKVILRLGLDQLEYERRLIEAKASILERERTFLLEGWLPAAKLHLVEAGIRCTTKGAYLLQAKPARDCSGEDVPTLLEHGWLLRPFAMLVTAYGVPSYRELVPTLFLAVTYLLMFGLMFGDWGHGLVLLSVGLVLLRRRDLDWAPDVGVLLVAGGLSSVAFGVIFGSCFGLAAVRPYALWHDPLEGNPAELMLGTIALGAIVLSLGVTLNIVNRFRRGESREAVLGKFGILGLLFYWGMIGLVVSRFAFPSASSVYWVAPALLLPLTVWTLREPVELLTHNTSTSAEEPPEELGTALASSLIEAFDAVLVFFANSISFVRLAAYAMSHAALLMAIFSLADQVATLPTLGPFLRVLVIALGNLVILAMEGTIAAVQALRLQYYEFFGKFYGGSGYAFAPFRL